MNAVPDSSVLQSAERWAGQLPDRSLEIEQARRLPADISEGFASTGIYHMLVPSEFGGGEVHPQTFVDVIRRVAEGDGSAGWNVMIGSTTGLLAASLPEGFGAEIYGNAPGVLTVGVTAPLGRAERIEGGYRITGRWPFGSGSQNAHWISGGCFVFENGEQVKNDKGAPEVHLMMFHRDQVVIENTWQVSGLCGTGSHHFHVDNEFVPEGRSVVLGGRTRVQRPLYQFPMLGLLALGVSSVSLGIGYKALAAFIDLADAKKPTGSSRSLAMRPQVQAMVAESTADLDSARAYMTSVIDAAWEQAQSGERLSTETKASLRLAAANATHRSVAAVDRLYQAGGGTSIYEDSPLQRCFRDIHVSTQHIMVAAPVYEVIGRVQLGLPPGSLL